MTTVKMPLALVAIFIWVGFVCAISFMEAWLKFRAPGITLPLGLGIGRLVFNALNKVEWVLAIVVAVQICWGNTRILTGQNAILATSILILIVQSVWLLPALDARAEMHIQGQVVPPSYNHFYYVGLELIKVGCLVSYGISLFKTVKL